MRFGVTAQTVKRRMALGRVSPVLLVHYQKGDLSLEALQAYTLTDDHARQEAAYAGLGYSASGTAHGPFAVPMHSPMTEYFLDADGRGATRPRRGVAGARFEIANVWYRSFDLSKRTDRKPSSAVDQLARSLCLENDRFPDIRQERSASALGSAGTPSIVIFLKLEHAASSIYIDNLTSRFVEVLLLFP